MGDHSSGSRVKTSDCTTKQTQSYGFLKPHRYLASRCARPLDHATIADLTIADLTIIDLTIINLSTADAIRVAG